MPGSKPLGLLGILCVSALLAGSCTADPPPRAAPTTGPGADRLVASVVQQRLDEGTRRIGIEVSTGPATSMHVVGARLESPGFRPVPVAAKDTLFAPRQTIDLTTTFGAARCSGVDPTDGLSVRLDLQTADGESTVHLPVTGRGAGLVRRLHRSSCAEAALRRAAPVSYGGPFVRAVVAGETVLAGDLVLRRPATGGSGDPVMVESLGGSVLFEVAPLRAGRGTTSSLGPDEQVLRLPVRIGSTGRCDQHARSQSTQTFLFSVYVSVGPRAQHREILVPPARLQRRSLALLDDVCSS